MKKQVQGFKTGIIAVILPALLLAQPAVAQRDPAGEWIVRQILYDTLHRNPYSSQWVAPARMLYWPEDIGYAPGNDAGSYDPLVRQGSKLLYLVEGTGRVYEVSAGKPELVYRRLDETIYAGYNYGALNFIFRDTLWSFGGYGFWRANGHLRYFSDGVKGWEIMPVSRRVQHINTKSNNFLDRDMGKLYVMQEPLLDDGLKKIRPRTIPAGDTIKLLVLDMNTKDWSIAGTLNEPNVSLMGNPGLTTDLQWGKLVVMGPKSGFKAKCLDFRNNKILVIRDQALGTKLYDGFYPGRNSLTQPNRTLNYHVNDTLHLINSNQSHIRIRLTRDDFIETGEQIFREIDNASINLMDWAWLALGTGLLALLAGIMLTIRSNQLVREMQPDNNLNPLEKELIQSLLLAGKDFLSTDAVDAIVVPDGRSQDSIKKKRSSVIRSINDKYSELTGDQDPLITSTRMHNDRRMMRYGIVSEKTIKAKKLL